MAKRAAKRTTGTRKTRIDRPSTMKFIALGDMAVSLMAQRPLRPHRVNKLLSEFNPDLLGVLTINIRDGHSYVVDGQHRYYALREWLGKGWEKQKMECAVFVGLTEQQEAAMWLVLNDQLAQAMIDRFWVGITARGQTEIEIAAVVQGCGLSVAGGPSKNTGIRSIGSLYKVYERGGDEVLRRTLEILGDAFGDPGFSAIMIDGLSLFVQRYNSQADNKRVIEALGGVRGGVNGLIGTAEQLKHKTGATKAICIAATIVTIVNRSAGKKLPTWWKK